MMFELFSRWSQSVTDVTRVVTGKDPPNSNDDSDVTDVTSVTSDSDEPESRARAQRDQPALCRKGGNTGNAVTVEDKSPDSESLGRTSVVTSPDFVPVATVTGPGFVQVSHDNPRPGHHDDNEADCLDQLTSYFEIAGDLERWSSLPLDELAKLDVALRITSDEFGDFWLVSNPGARHLTDDPAAPNYTAAEAQEIVRLSAHGMNGIRVLHGLKKEFGGRMVRPPKKR